MNNEKIIYISGMSCDNCRRHVQEALSKIESVKMIEIDLASGRTRIIFSKESPSDDQIRSAIENAGYQVAGHSVS